VLLLAVLVLGASAQLRSAEYDEQYTLFLTAGTPRPDWPQGVFPAGTAQHLLTGHVGFTQIAVDLRRTDVHPPLYFWIVGLWRQATGNGLTAARLLSVAFSLGALAAVGSIARRMSAPPALAMLLTLGCYGFAYTGAIARNFALAQLLTLLGWAWGQRGRIRDRAAAGALFGGAVLTNYLALFVTGTMTAWWVCKDLHRNQCGNADRVQRWRSAATIGTLVPFLLADLWFFVVQRNARTGQFPPFHWLTSLVRLARYMAATVFGGLPLYAGGSARALVSATLASVLLMLAALIVRQWRSAWLPLALAAGAPPAGLLALGFIFDNTPIELRYLAFASPFIALLLAGAIGSLPARVRHAAAGAVLLVQAAGIGGLLTRPETMQPARITAAAAAQLVQDGIVLLPRGNDGVGIVGAFVLESPPALRLLLIGPNDTPNHIRARVAPFRRVVLALLEQDAASRSAVAAMRAAFAVRDWHPVGHGFNVIVYERGSRGE